MPVVQRSQLANRELAEEEEESGQRYCQGAALVQSENIDWIDYEADSQMASDRLYMLQTAICQRETDMRTFNHAHTARIRIHRTLHAFTLA